MAYAFGRTMVTDPPYGVNYDPAFSLTGFDIRRCDEFELGELFAERTQGRTDPQMRSHGRQFLLLYQKGRGLPHLSGSRPRDRVGPLAGTGCEQTRPQTD